MSNTCLLQREFHTFFNHVKHLRRLQKETLEAIENVGKSGNLSEEQLVDLRFNSEEIEDLRRALHVPTCIVITGQSFYGKLALVTRLLGEQIIPIVHVKKKKSDSYSYRSVQIEYNANSNCALFDSVIKKEEEETEEEPSKIFDPLTLEDLEIANNNVQESKSNEGIIEISLHHGLLREGLQIIITPTSSRRTPKSFSLKSSSEFLRTLFPTVFPIVLYAITKITFTDEEVVELREMKETQPKLSVLFIRVPPLPDSFAGDLPESEQHDILCKLGILPMPIPTTKAHSRSRRVLSCDNSDEHSSEEDSSNSNASNQRTNSKYRSMPERLLYVLCDKIGCLTRKIPPQKLHQRLIEGELKIYNDYADDLNSFLKILNYFNLVLNGQLIKAATLLHQGHTRCMRMFILFAFDMAREIQITPRRINYAKEKEGELFENLIVIASKKQDEIKNVIMESLSEIRESLLEKATNYEFKDVELPENMEDLTARDVRLCTLEIQELVLGALNEAVGRQLALRLDIMRKSYLGTLQRCLENLEKDCRDCGESTNIGDALKQMMNAAYQLEVTTSTSSSALRNFLEKMKQLVTAMPGSKPPVIDSDWKNKVAVDMLSNLSESKLAKNICTQFRERLKMSHDSFVVSMKQLESQLTCRLEQKEENHLRMKKCDAPKLARMSLESTSMRDMILYGMPVLEREVGRGQYGVVFGCKTWGGNKPCAIKSLVPMDDKHWNDLAMEFHYTRSVPEHDRIVSLRGSVIDYSYGQGETPAVLLIMDRLNRDLYSGIKTGLAWLDRLRIALDVTQGIRFLHSQGLVHRDIKLKNVLLDPQNRARLTDLGFCKPEAMMSGSIVGTPIHMAPELFTGHYDNSVDVYAFGILFWYICAGHVKLPLIFEQCHSKDQLWQCVRKGARPERLPNFTDKCWELMTVCWAGEPSERPFLGNLEPRIENIMEISRRNLEKANKIKEGHSPDAEKKSKDSFVIEENAGKVKFINEKVECAEDALSQCDLSL